MNCVSLSDTARSCAVVLLSAVCVVQELFSTSGAWCFLLLVTVHLVHKTVCSRLEALHATWLKKTSCVHLIPQNIKNIKNIKKTSKMLVEPL